MIDITKIINEYCIDNNLLIKLSFDMPLGYETANAMYDDETKTIYINLNTDLPEYELTFYLYLELRHALQYSHNHKFSDQLLKSLNYAIMYDGNCYKNVNGKFFHCKIDGDGHYLLNLYKGQLYEIDANDYAYGIVRRLFGDTFELKELYNLFQPTKKISFCEYERIYKLIDEKLCLK